MLSNRIFIGFATIFFLFLIKEIICASFSTVHIYKLSRILFIKFQQTFKFSASSSEKSRMKLKNGLKISFCLKFSKKPEIKL